MTPNVTAYQEPPEAELGIHYERSELGNARRLVDTRGQDLHYVPPTGRWLVWDGRRWADDQTGQVARWAKQMADRILDEARADPPDDRLFRWGIRSQSSAGINNTLALAWSEPGIPVLVDQLDSDPWTLNVNNGTIDLRTGQLGPHRRDDLITKIVPVNYNPDTPAPRWERFLEEIFAGAPDLTGFVRRYAGYSLTGHVTEHIFAFCHGTGANGKSTLLGTLGHLLGDYAITLDPTVLTLADHDRHPTAIADLQGARYVTTIETEADRRLAEVLIKTLTGGDRIRARRMHRDFYEFGPSHSLWLAGNHLPKIVGTDEAIWRRVALVPFAEQFTGARADPHLGDQLAGEAEGILAWAIRGCAEWQKHGLNPPGRVQTATANYRASQDHVGRFLVDRCTTADTAHVTARDLRAAYEQWCNEQGEKPWTGQAVGRELTSRGYDSVKGAKGARSWLGIGLLDGVE